MIKAKHTPSYPFCYKRAIKLGLGAAAVFVCGFMAFTAAFINIGYIEQSLDPAFLPTAEYLYAHPQPTLVYVQIQSQISEASPALCYDVWRKPQAAFLNMVRLPFTFSTDAIYDTFNGTAARRSRFCYDASDLVPGLHLMELRFKGEGDRPIIYQWAVMVDE